MVSTRRTYSKLAVSFLTKLWYKIFYYSYSEGEPTDHLNISYLVLPLLCYNLQFH